MTTADRPARRTMRWVGSGAASLAGAFAIPVVDGGEVEEPWWSIVTLLAVISTIFIVIGLSALANVDLPRADETDP